MNYGNNQDQAVMGANGRQMGLVIPEGEPWALVGKKAEGACSGFLVPSPPKMPPLSLSLSLLLSKVCQFGPSGV